MNKAYRMSCNGCISHETEQFDEENDLIIESDLSELGGFAEKMIYAANACLEGKVKISKEEYRFLVREASRMDVIRTYMKTEKDDYIDGRVVRILLGLPMPGKEKVSEV